MSQRGAANQRTSCQKGVGLKQLVSERGGTEMVHKIKKSYYEL